MSTAKLAWGAFMRVLAEISEAHREGASADEIHELFQHAGELLEIMDEEIDNEPLERRREMRSAVVTMRARLVALDPERATSEALTSSRCWLSWRWPHSSTQGRVTG
jgi:hypothetical protein